LEQTVLEIYSELKIRALQIESAVFVGTQIERCFQIVYWWITLFRSEWDFS